MKEERNDIKELLFNKCHSKLDLESHLFKKQKAEQMLKQVQHDLMDGNSETLNQFQGNSVNVRGFTLIELLVVVLIIGILSAVALPQYEKAVFKSRLTEVFINIKAMRTCLKEYELANGLPASGSVPLKNMGCAVELSGGEWSGNTYVTKNFRYYASCTKSNGCYFEVQENRSGCDEANCSRFYIVSDYGNGKDLCCSQGHALGRWICQSNTFEGFEYANRSCD